MGRRGLSAAIVLATAFFVSAAPAAAGGSSWEVEPAAVAPGDEVHVWAPVAWAHNDALGTPDDGPWRAWMIPSGSNTLASGSNPTAFGEIPGHAIPIGEIEVVEEPYRHYGPNHAKFTFTLPDVPPGRYEILHCNDPCTNTLGDITWGVFEVITPDGEASAAVPAPPLESTSTSSSSTTTSTTSTTSTTADPESEIDGELAVATAPVDDDAAGSGWWIVPIAILALTVAVIALRASRRTPHGSDQLRS